MNKTTATIILSLVCAASYQALGDEIEVKSLNRSSTGFFVFHLNFRESNQATRSTLSPPTRGIKFTRCQA